MDFSKLSQNEKLAVYGSAALIIGGLVGYSYGLTVLGMLAAIAMLAVVLLPQLSPGTALPGTRGSLMVAVGGLAGVAMVIALLQAITGVLLVNTNLGDIFFLVAVAGGLLMAWAGWQEFQSEGGRFQIGSGGPGATSAAATERRGADATESAPAEPSTATQERPAADSAARDEREAEDGRPVA